MKVMLPSIAKKAAARDRFLREARITAAIEHDHIVTIYEVNEDNGVPYLAMQLLKGMTVDDWLKAGKTFNIPQVMRIGKEIAKGLAAAHACNLIHRDIKPSNIWLDSVNRGRVKILDFGLAGEPVGPDGDFAARRRRSDAGRFADQ
jgi:serine/threonine protein kinase